MERAKYRTLRRITEILYIPKTLSNNINIGPLKLSFFPANGDNIWQSTGYNYSSVIFYTYLKKNLKIGIGFKRSAYYICNQHENRFWWWSHSTQLIKANQHSLDLLMIRLNSNYEISTKSMKMIVCFTLLLLKKPPCCSFPGNQKQSAIDRIEMELHEDQMKLFSNDMWEEIFFSKNDGFFRVFNHGGTRA